MNIDVMKSLGGKYGVFTETIQKDYAATILLFIISEFDKISEMIFKGGTALKKIYFPNGRFSEDLDFTCSTDISNELETLLNVKIQECDINFTKIEKIKTGRTSKKFSVKYLNYNNYPMSVKIDLSHREKVLKTVETLPIQHFYDLKNNNFSIPSMNIEEIFAEKIRALIYAQKSRHLYDIWYLFQHRIQLNMDLVDSKLVFYDEDFSLDKIKIAINKMKTEWDKDLGSLLPSVPSIDEISRNVIHNIDIATKS